MHGFVDPPGTICAMYAVQNGLCFHCSKPMIFLRSVGAQKNLLATREHIFPASSTGKFLHHNFVLAHSSCNHKRGDKAPTDDEIERAKAIYKQLGLVPFIHDDVYRVHPEHALVASKKETHFRKTYSTSGFVFPTLGDIWPK